MFQLNLALTVLPVTMGGGQSSQSGSKSITDHDRAVADLKSQMARLDRLQKQVRQSSPFPGLGVHPFNLLTHINQDGHEK